jgi:hypothetical protein
MILDQQIIDLINADIDGALGPEEKRELESILDSSSEAAGFRDELLQLNKVINDVPELDPPADLTRIILDQVQLPARRRLFQLPAFLTNFNPATAGLAFAAGLLMAVGFYQVASPKVSQHDMFSMVGTMVGDQQIKAPGKGDRLTLAMDGLSGSVALNVNEYGQALEFNLESELAFEIKLDFDNAGLMLNGFAQDDLGDGSLIESLELSGGTMRVVNRGKHHFVVFLKQQPGMNVHGRDIRIGISREGERVYEDPLQSWR